MNYKIIENLVKKEYLSLFKRRYDKEGDFVETVFISEWNEDAYITIVNYFLKRYEEERHREHPNITQQTIKQTVNNLHYLVDANFDVIELLPEDYPPMIDNYFEQTFYNCNYSLPHFMSGDIRLYRYYEVFFH